MGLRVHETARRPSAAGRGPHSNRPWRAAPLQPSGPTSPPAAAPAGSPQLLKAHRPPNSPPEFPRQPAGSPRTPRAPELFCSDPSLPRPSGESPRPLLRSVLAQVAAAPVPAAVSQTFDSPAGTPPPPPRIHHAGDESPPGDRTPLPLRISAAGIPSVRKLGGPLPGLPSRR